MDRHHLACGRTQGLGTVLQNIRQKTLIIGISSDILCPLHEQEFIASHLGHATFIGIDSAYGHDGFILESEKISYYLSGWLRDTAE